MKPVDSESADNSTVAHSEPMTEPEVEDKEAPVQNKYEILEYLLKFVKTDQEVNPVLAGYFSKLILVLLQSK